MSISRLTITDSITKAQLESLIRPSSSDAEGSTRRLSDHLKGLMAKVFSTGALLELNTGAAKATATLTVSSTGSSADETVTIANVVFTAKASGATGNQFNVSTTPATQAASMAAAINASPDLAGIVTAEAALGVVTLTAVVPGALGNGLQISEALTNVALAAFSGGSDGSSYSIDLR